MIKIRLATLHDSAAWDAFVSSHPHGLASHRWAWMASVREAYGFSSVPLLAERDGAVAGVFPVVALRLPWGRPWAVSVPYADVGGPLAEDDETVERLLNAAPSFLRRLGCTSVEVRLASQAFSAPAESHRLEVSKVRMVLDLPETADALLKSLKAKVRSQVKKPIRDGLTVRTGGGDLMGVFWRIYCRNMRDLGSPPHPLRWFKAIALHFGSNVTTTVVFLPDGTPAAAGVTLRCGDTVTIPWASSLREHNRWNPNMLLYWTLLSHAVESGARRFDFGRSTPGEGTYRFKAQWGAREEPLGWFRRDGSGWAPVLSAKGPGRVRALGEQVLSSLPVSVNTALGALARRYISL